MKDTRTIAYIALIAAVGALIISITNNYQIEQLTHNFNLTRSAAEVQMEAEQLVNRVRSSIQELENPTDEVVENTASEIRDTRRDLLRMYKDTDDATVEQVNEIATQLKQAEESVRSNTAGTIDSLQEALEQLEQLVRIR